MNTVRSLFDNSDNSKELELAFQRKFARQHFLDVARFPNSNNSSDYTSKGVSEETKEVAVELNPLYALELLSAIEKIHYSIRKQVSFELLYEEALKVMSIEQMNKLDKLAFHRFADRIVWTIARKYKS